MTPEPTRPLSPDARRLLDAVAAQAERHDVALQGLCATIEVHHVQRGRFGLSPEPEASDGPLGDAEATNAAREVLPMLTGTAFERRELPAEQPGTVCVRITRREPPGTGEFAQAVTLTRQPPELVEARLDLRPPAGLPRWAVPVATAILRYRTLGGVPLPVEVRMQFRTRGLGPFRVDQEMITRMTYAPCEPDRATD